MCTIVTKILRFEIKDKKKSFYKYERCFKSLNDCAIIQKNLVQKSIPLKTKGAKFEVIKVY